MILGNATIASVQGYLAKGELTQRQIARAVGVSRGTVQAVAAGRRTQEIDAELVRDAKSRLDGGMFESRVSKKMGISRQVVRRIATGQFDHLLEPQGNYAMDANDPKKRCKKYVPLLGDRPNAKPERCPGCGGLIYRDDLGQCTLCTVREAIARGGVNTNVAIPDVSEVEGALFGMTYAVGAVLDNVEAVDQMDTVYRVTTDAEKAEHCQQQQERQDAARAKARLAIDQLAEKAASRLIDTGCRDEDHIVYVSGATIAMVRELLAAAEPLAVVS